MHRPVIISGHYNAELEKGRALLGLFVAEGGQELLHVVLAWWVVWVVFCGRWLAWLSWRGTSSGLYQCAFLVLPLL